MGFIKDALLGVAIYEGLKYYIRKSKAEKQANEIILGGKHFARTQTQLSPDAKHRHHLDRPEIIDEPG